MSYRIWWLIAFAALGIGAAIEHEPRAGADAAAKAEAAQARLQPAPLAAQKQPARGG